MFLHKIITNKFFLYLTGTLLVCNFIDFIFFLKRFPDDVILFSAIVFNGALYLLINKSIINFATKIFGFALLSLFLKGQISQLNFLPITAIYYSEDYVDRNDDGDFVNTLNVETVFFDTKQLNCNTKKELIYNTEKQPIDSWQCFSCNSFTTNKIDKILESNFEDYSFNSIKCYLKFKYFIFSGSAVVNGYTDISSNKNSSVFQFIQYQIEALIYISLSVSLTFLISMLYRKIRQ